MQKVRDSLSLAVSLAVAVSASDAVQAQEEPTLEEVFVLGQKIQRSLQDTKESVAVFDQEFMLEQRIFDLREVLEQTANAASINNGQSFAIRGVAAGGGSTGGSGSGELASLFYDNVALTGFARRFGPRAMWDIAQVEVLRGPQSTNIGRNAMVGAMVMTSRRPDPEAFDAAVRLEAGNYGAFGVEGMVNIPMFENSALRLTAETYESDGFVENITIPNDEFANREQETFRARFLTNPSDQLTIIASVQYSETVTGDQTYRADLIDDVEDRISTANLNGTQDFEGWIGSLDISYDLSDTWSFQSITAILDGEYDRFDDDDEGPGGGEAFRGRVGTEENWSQELRLTHTGERLSGVAGLWYTELEQVNNTTGLVNLFPAFLGVPDVLLPFYPERLGIDVFAPQTQETTNYAFFTEWDYQLSDRWTLSAGFRYDYEELDRLSNSANSLAPGSELPDPVEAGQIADAIFPGAGLGPIVTGGVAGVNAVLNGLLAPTDNPLESTDYDAFLPQVGATYAFSDDVSVSAFYKRGYRAGGSELTLLGAENTFDPEFLDTYEVSLRSVLMDGAMTLNANVFFSEWSDQQVVQCLAGPTSCVTENAGESELWGFEVESRYTISDNASMYLTLGYTDSEFIDFLSDEQDFSGNSFAEAPDWTAAIGGSVDLTDNLTLSGSVTHTGRQYAMPDNLVELSDYTLVNANVRYRADRYDVMLYGRNLADEFYLVSDFTDVDGVTRFVRAGAPREFGLLVQINY